MKNFSYVIQGKGIFTKSSLYLTSRYLRHTLDDVIFAKAFQMQKQPFVTFLNESCSANIYTKHN